MENKLLLVKIHEAGSWINQTVCSITSSTTPQTHTFSYAFTCISAVGLITLIYAINNSVTAVGVGSTASFITLKGEVATAAVRWGNRIVLDAVPLIGLKFHAVWTATHSTEGGSRETEVTAAPVGHHIAPASECCQEDNEEAVSGFLDYYI